MYGCITTESSRPYSEVVGGYFERIDKLIFEPSVNENVMSEAKSNHTKWLHIRLKEADYNTIKSYYESSTCRKLSEYARKILLNKPIKVYHRNQSLDDFMTELIVLRNELNAIGNNYNQTVKRLHSLQEIPEIKAWLLFNQNNQKILLQKVAEIKLKMDKINDQWLQK